MNGYLKVGVLEVNHEHEVPFPDRPQHQRDGLHPELNQVNIAIQTQQVDHRMSSPLSTPAQETAGCSNPDPDDLPVPRHFSLTSCPLLEVTKTGQSLRHRKGTPEVPTRQVLGRPVCDRGAIPRTLVQWNVVRSRLIILINEEINEANWMVSNSAKLDRRTKQHNQFGVSASNGSRDMARTKSWRKKRKKLKKQKITKRIGW